MAKAFHITDLQPNQVAHGLFRVKFKDARQKKTGDYFLTLVLADRTGEIEARMFDNVDGIKDSFDRDDYVKVKGMPQVYQNRLQFLIHTLAPVAADSVDPRDFLPASRRDPDAMFSELREIIGSIGNPHLRALLEEVFADERIAERFRWAPAAKGIHHAWLSGLLEHVLSLCTLCRQVAPSYEGVDLDLLLTGAILHDIGKIEELSYDRGFGYTDEGQLIGHLMIGFRIVQEKSSRISDFPAKLLTLLQHMILSHHGQLEFGSPKVPMFGEALLLHLLDNLDSKMVAMRAAIENDKLVDGTFTNYVSSMERPFLKKDRYLSGLPEPAVPGAGNSAEATPPMDGQRGQAVASQAAKPSTGGLFAQRLGEALRGD